MILLVVDTQNLIMNNDLYELQTFVYRIKTPVSYTHLRAHET